MRLPEAVITRRQVVAALTAILVAGSCFGTLIVLAIIAKVV